MKCPDCDSQLFTFEHNPAGDHPELVEWLVECIICKYVYDGYFATKEEAQKFIEEPRIETKDYRKIVRGGLGDKLKRMDKAWAKRNSYYRGMKKPNYLKATWSLMREALGNYMAEDGGLSGRVYKLISRINKVRSKRKTHLNNI